MRNPLISKAAVSLTLLLTARRVLAQDPTGGAASSPTPPAEAGSAAVAPTLKEHADPVYPADALRDRVAGTVGLEIVVDETVHVVDAKVVQPAGHGFDEAALAAVRTWAFEPARQNDAAVRAAIQLSCPSNRHRCQHPRRSKCLPLRPRRPRQHRSNKRTPRRRSCSGGSPSAPRRLRQCATVTLRSARSARCKTFCA